MDHRAGTSSIPSSNSTPSSPVSPASAVSTGSSSSLLERRNRRRSSAISGPHPAEVPLTESDQILANTIARINLQNARESGEEYLRSYNTAATATPQKLLPALVVPHLDLTRDSAKAIENPTSSNEKTPTQSTWRLLSTDRTDCTVYRTHIADGSQSKTTFHLFPILDTSEQITPTNWDQGALPIRLKPKLSSISSQAQGQLELFPDRKSPNRGDERSPESPGEVPLSPYCSLTRRMYANSPLSSNSSQSEGKNTGKVSPQGNVNTEDVCNKNSSCEVFPPFQEN